MQATTPVTPKKRLPLERTLLQVIVVVVLFNIFIWWRLKDPEPPVVLTPDEPSAPSFEGESTDLKQSLMVPSLETVLPANRSAIWAATSNLAWKELHTLAGGDITFDGLPELSKQWNQGIKLNPGLEAQHYYVKAGYKSKGIYDIVRREMAERFPTMKPPAPDTSPQDAILAIACLNITMKYQHAFLNDEEPMVFRDSSGSKTKVKSFGIRKKDADGVNTMRSQIAPYFHDGQGHYAVDLSSGMQPYQVVLACIERGPTLAATLEAFDQRVKAAQANPELRLSFGNDSILSVPNMEWSITHHYRELLDKVAQGPKLPDAIKFTEAMQEITFRMDRSGVSVASQMRFAGVLLNGDEVHRTGHYIFDQPYLLIVRKRGNTDPIFVMWVDNAELLRKW